MAQPTEPADAAASPTAATDSAAGTGVENSVVKVFSTARPPDPYKPWNKSGPNEGTGSGVVIPGKRILTNAHVVAYASRVEVQAHQASEKIFAQVESIAYGIDLAVLKLDDEAFFETHPPLPQLERIPEIKDTVLVYGYPRGGTNLSITKGIVSRVEFTNYRQFVGGLRIQVDAAINPGNSGGPVVVDGKMIGLAFASLREAEKIGYIIPMEEIAVFLADVADGRYDGKPTAFDNVQDLENPSLRRYLKVPVETKGMVVTQPFLDGPPTPLKAMDVITAIGPHPVDNEGMVKLGPKLRIDASYYIEKLSKQGRLP